MKIKFASSPRFAKSILLRSRDINICLICKLVKLWRKVMYRLLGNHVYLRDKQTKSLKTLQLNVSQHTIIKQNQLSFNNPADIHDFPICT